ncbi:hypothetical protein ADUPG1_001800, partial [Aduncisulcus paluster]
MWYIFDISRFYKGILIKRVTSVAYNTAFVVCIARISVLSFSLRGSASLFGTVVLGCTVSTGLIPVTVPLSLTRLGCAMFWLALHCLSTIASDSPVLLSASSTV